MNEHQYQVGAPHLQLPSRDHLTGQIELALLQLEALRKQLAASRAWGALMRGHEQHGSSWAAVLQSALAAGLSPERLKEILAASPSTYSRWVSGVVQPSAMLRKRLAPEVFESVAALARENEGLIGERERLLESPLRPGWKFGASAAAPSLALSPRAVAAPAPPARKEPTQVEVEIPAAAAAPAVSRDHD
jgi:transcriptional regulator with XRE-family HTH domain